ncbi:hypothetical protein F751_1178 [Auxenochlorella protothecoides]|uniref:Uncharacterized protein n=1 Tax=Auxenochlorella protothecoides TaxID=3075 RepID=A0A087SNU7_AUXPR|nr:hypothetical protein F751_1178 [Auxenochlorella protothecoides]KFM27401.1 hypothetical protein F751_1178 [Auxenochlorella protothecoides]
MLPLVLEALGEPIGEVHGAVEASAPKSLLIYAAGAMITRPSRQHTWNIVCGDAISTVWASQRTASQASHDLGFWGIGDARTAALRCQPFNPAPHSALQDSTRLARGCEIPALTLSPCNGHPRTLATYRCRGPTYRGSSGARSTPDTALPWYSSGSWTSHTCFSSSRTSRPTSGRAWGSPCVWVCRSWERHGGSS